MTKTTIKQVPRALRAIQNTPQFIKAEREKKKKEEEEEKSKEMVMVRIPRELWLNVQDSLFVTHRAIFFDRVNERCLWEFKFPVFDMSFLQQQCNKIMAKHFNHEQ